MILTTRCYHRLSVYLTLLTKYFLYTDKSLTLNYYKIVTQDLCWFFKSETI